MRLHISSLNLMLTLILTLTVILTLTPSLQGGQHVDEVLERVCEGLIAQPYRVGLGLGLGLGLDMFL